MSQGKKVLIVGAGLAGLNAAVHLNSKNIAVEIVEASGQIGGRVRTERIEGFTLDHGFQVLLTSYEEAQRSFEFGGLQLNRFAPGALVKTEKGLYNIGDPIRNPRSIFSTLTSPIGTFSDKIRLAHLALSSRYPFLQYQSNCRSAIEELKARGFSDSIIESFFRPFFSGVFLDSSLETDARFFLYMFQQFATGYACLPEKGMQALAAQLHARLPRDSVRLLSPVTAVQKNQVSLNDGSVLKADVVILAVSHNAAIELFNSNETPSEDRRTTCVYYECEGLDWVRNRIVLNATGRGVICNLCVPNLVAESYAPKGRQLLSVSTIAEVGRFDDPLHSVIRKELCGWFSDRASHWRHIKTIEVKHALPSVWGTHSYTDFPQHIIYCGDYTEQPSIQGALLSGRKAAEESLKILED